MCHSVIHTSGFTCLLYTSFGFYRVAADQADKLLEVIKDLLKDPDGNKEMLAPQMCIRDSRSA